MPNEEVRDLRSERGFEEKLVTIEWLSQECERLRNLNKRIVFTNGCFDMIHRGHVTYLQQAARLGDVLIIGINSDASVRRLKGPQRPIVDESNRAAVIAALGFVDYVVVFEEDNPCQLICKLTPDILAKGGDYTVDQVVGKDLVEAYGGQVVVTGKIAGQSSSSIIEHLRGTIAKNGRPHHEMLKLSRASESQGY